MSMWLVYREDYDGAYTTITPLSVWYTEVAALDERARKSAKLVRGSWTSYEVDEVEVEPTE